MLGELYPGEFDQRVDDVEEECNSDNCPYCKDEYCMYEDDCQYKYGDHEEFCGIYKP